MIVLEFHQPADAAAPPVVEPWVLVALSGDVNAGSRAAMDVLHQAVASRTAARVLVDLTDVRSLDAAALAELARARSDARTRGGVLSLHGASGSTQHLLEAWHLEAEPS